MPVPVADPTPRRTPKALASLAGLACVACCLLPMLIAAGVVGACASAVVGWQPAAALALAALAGATWWLSRRRGGASWTASGQGGCGCKQADGPLQTTSAGRR